VVYTLLRCLRRAHYGNAPLAVETCHGIGLSNAIVQKAREN
jgi:hypothetical protein